MNHAAAMGLVLLGRDRAFGAAMMAPGVRVLATARD